MEKNQKFEEIMAVMEAKGFMAEDYKAFADHLMCCMEKETCLPVPFEIICRKNKHNPMCEFLRFPDPERKDEVWGVRVNGIIIGCRKFA